MLKSVSKKIMSGFLAAAMVVTLMPATPAQAATASISGKTAALTGTSYSYTVKNVTKNQYIKVKLSGTATSATATVAKKTVKNGKTSAFVKGTGKDLTFKVAAKNAGKSYKLTVKVYKKDKKTVVKNLTTTVKVYSHSISKITGSTTVEVGKKVTLKAVKKYSQSKKAVTWTSSKTSVATVGKTTGVVTGKKAGTATITATCGTSKKSVKVTVKAKAEEEKPDEPTKPDDTVSGDTTSGDSVSGDKPATSGDSVSGDKPATSGDSVSGDKPATSGDTVSVNVLSIKQTGAKKITVEMSKAVTVNAIAISRNNTIAVPLDSTTPYTVSGSSVIITTATKLNAYDYKVSVNGIVTELTGQAEKPGSFEVSETAALYKNSDGTVSKNKAVAKFKVLNQFGEDATSVFQDVTVAGGYVTTNQPDLKDGKIYFVKDGDFNAALDTLVVSLTCKGNDLGVIISNTFQVKLGDAPYINTLKIMPGIYDATGVAVTLKEGTVTTNLAGKYIHVEAKDQYGDAIAVSTDNTVVSFAGGLTNLVDSKDWSYEGETGVSKFAVSANKELAVGTAQLILVGKDGYGRAEQTFNVESVAHISSLTVENTDVYAGGDDVVVKYEALDADGNKITSYDKLAELSGMKTEKDDKFGSNDGYIYVEKNYATNEGILHFVVKDGITVTHKVPLVFVTKDYKTIQVTMTVSKDPEPTAISKTKDLTTGVLSGKTYSVTKNNFVVVDQYGRDITTLNNTKVSANSYEIVATSTDSTKKVISTDSWNGNGFGTLSANEVTTTTKGQVKYSVACNGKVVANSDYTVTFTVAPESAITNYKLDAVAPIYCGSGRNDSYNKNVKAYGLLADNTRIDGIEFRVVTSNNLNVSGNTLSPNADLTAAGKVLNGTSSVTEKVKVVINATGQELEAEVTLSKVAPAVKKVEYVTSNATYIKIANDAKAVSADDVLAQLKVTDTYDVENGLAIDAARVTFTGLNKDKNSTIKVEDNGTDHSKVKVTSGTFAEGPIATAQVTFKDGTIKVFPVVCAK